MNFDETGLVGDQKWFYHWIIEREKCRIGREGNLPKPWSDDVILQSYRFCNVRRESDKVTLWIKENWRDPHDSDEVGSQRMVFAMCAARLFNRISTLELIGFPRADFIGWIEDTRITVKQARAKGEPIWTGAYLVSTNGHSVDKVDYILDHVLKPIAKSVHGSKSYSTLEQYHAHLTIFDGLGSFMAGQVIADLKYTSALAHASDWDSWAPIGPGSRRGMNIYQGRPNETSIKAKRFLEELLALQLEIKLRINMHIPVHDVQNCLCEYSKYVKVLKGTGKPRSLYDGKRS